MCSQKWDASQKRYIDAYFEFLDKFGQAWISADKSHMAPPAVTMIAQSAIAAAGHAAETIGNLQLFVMTGVPAANPEPERTAPKASEEAT